jgi:hypothetical protein
MKPIKFTTINNTSLVIIPDTQAHVDGHPVLSFTYSLYRDGPGQKMERKYAELHLEKHHDPNYLGFITFELPGKLFTYTPYGQQPLDRSEVEEVIEHVSHVRDNPALWRFDREDG